MKVSKTAPNAFTLEFETQDELRAEYQSNLASGGLRLETTEKLANFAALALTLRCAGREASTKATVVGLLPGAVAVAVESKPDALLAALTAPEAEEAGAPEAEAAGGSTWDRIRSLSRVEKLQ